MDKDLILELLEKQQAFDYIKYACQNLLAFSYHDEIANPCIIKEDYAMEEFTDVIERFIELVKENRELKSKLGINK